MRVCWKDDAQVEGVPPNNTSLNAFPKALRSYCHTCGTFYTPSTAYPGGVAGLTGWQEALTPLLTIETIRSPDRNLTAKPPNRFVCKNPVANAPHSVVISSDGRDTAHVRQRGGKVAERLRQAEKQFCVFVLGGNFCCPFFFSRSPAGTEIVADQDHRRRCYRYRSVVDLASMKVTATVSTVYIRTGMGPFWGGWVGGGGGVGRGGGGGGGGGWWGGWGGGRGGGKENTYGHQTPISGGAIFR